MSAPLRLPVPNELAASTSTCLCRSDVRPPNGLDPDPVIARGWAGPSLLAMVLFEKFGQHSDVDGVMILLAAIDGCDSIGP
jgi:transposase